MDWREVPRRTLDGLDELVAAEQKKIWRRTWILAGCAAVLLVVLTLIAWRWEVNCLEWRETPERSFCREVAKGMWTCKPVKECVRHNW